MLSGLGRDLIHAVRSLAKARAFTLVSVVSLGVGMAPVIAIPYLSRISYAPPPAVETSRLAELVTTAQGPHAESDMWSYPDYVDLRNADPGLTLFASVGAAVEVAFQPGQGPKSEGSVLYVPAHYFATLNVPLARGAGFGPTADDPLAAAPEVIISHDFWENRLGASDTALGQILTLDGVPHLIVGIAPDQFSGHMGLSGKQLFLPLERHPGLRPGVTADKDLRLDRRREWLHVFGQMRPGVTVAQASAAVATVTARLATDHKATNEYRAGLAVAYDPMGSLTRRELRVAQLVIFTLTGAVLLVVALNVSGMMLVRSAMRERELSIRQAIGATRSRLRQYLLAEAMVLALAGGTLASCLLFNLPSLASWFAGRPLPPVIAQALTVDAPLIAICFGLCLATSLVFGWLPASRFSRPVILSSLKDDAGVGGLRVGRVHRFTAALQVAIAVPLLVMSGMSLDRMRATATLDLGFDAEQLYAAPLRLNDRMVEQATADIRRLRDTLATGEGIAAVTVADGLPLDFRYRMAKVALEVDANTAPRPIDAHVTRVGEGYAATMGMRIARGRAFVAEDRPGVEPVTIVSEALAKWLDPNGDVLGRTLVFGTDADKPQRLRIVGVVADMPTSQMSTTREQLWLPLAQHPGVRADSVAVSDDLSSLPSVLLVARSAPGTPAEQVTTAVMRLARELDPELPSTALVTGAGLRQNSIRDFLTQATVGAVAGGVVLLLAALGIYGVVGLMVATRTRELAVRVALGASRRRVLALVIRDVVLLVSPGIAIGLVLTLVLNRLNAENMGLSLSHAEPLAYAGGAVVAVLVAVLASLPPARRAASTEPMVAMRST